METGNLYRAKCLYWVLYRSEDEIEVIHSAVTAHDSARYWSMKCKASYIPPNSLFVFLEQKQKHCKVLTAEGNVGWIHLADWCRDDIEEVNID